jgi:DHA1 family tetracycline resistance protein-like MFS transporter
MLEPRNISIFTIFLTVFLDMLGIGIIIPVVAPVIINSDILSDSVSFSQKTLILGFLISSFPISQFFGAPFLGSLSDRIGRKRSLIYSILGSALGYFIFSYGIVEKNIYMLFLGRIIDGLSGGNVSVIYSSLADISDEKTKARNFGLVGAAFGLGFIFGPFIGGELSNPNIVSWFNYSTPFIFAGLLSLINLLFVIFKFQETLKEKKNSSLEIFKGFKNLFKIFEFKNLRTLFIISFFTTLGFTMFSQFFQVFLIKEFNYTQTNIGRLYGFFGIWSVITQGGIVRSLSKKYSPEKILNYSLILMSLTILIVIIPKNSLYLYITMPLVAITQGITSPNITALISNLSNDDSQGETLGLNQSMQSLANAIPPIIAGIVVSFNIKTPTIIASIFVLIAWIIFILKRNLLQVK